MLDLNLCQISLKTARDLGLRGVSEFRTPCYVYQKITEETAEAHEEIILNETGEDAGKDGIAGEAVDALISVLDMAFLVENDFDSAMKQLEIKDGNFSDVLTLPMEEVDVHRALHKCSSDLFRIQANLSVAVQILNGTSYKKPETFGYVTDVNYMLGILKEMTENCLFMFKLAYVIEDSHLGIEEKLYSIWVSKTNKWRKSRGLDLL